MLKRNKWMLLGITLLLLIAITVFFQVVGKGIERGMQHYHPAKEYKETGTTEADSRQAIAEEDIEEVTGQDLLLDHVLQRKENEKQARQLAQVELEQYINEVSLDFKELFDKNSALIKEQEFKYTVLVENEYIDFFTQDRDDAWAYASENFITRFFVTNFGKFNSYRLNQVQCRSRSCLITAYIDVTDLNKEKIETSTLINLSLRMTGFMQELADHSYLFSKASRYRFDKHVVSLPESIPFAFLLYRADQSNDQALEEELAKDID